MLYLSMKKLALLFIFVNFLIFAQGEQRYADGTATNQDGNTFEWINYGTQDWAIENAEVVTYRDGTPIPQVTDQAEWGNLTTGAWCYYNNDPSKGKLYNWYAAAGIHDNDSNTPNKEFAPVGWHVPTDADWTTLENYLIANGYNYDGTTTENKIAKSMASTSGWNSSTISGAVGNDQNLNNTSGFNASTTGNRFGSGFWNEGHNLIFWSADDSSEGNSCELAWYRSLYAAYNYLDKNRTCKRDGGYVRLIKDSQFVTTAQILLNGTVSAENNQIKNVADPTDAQDAVTKTFIENFIKNSVSMEFFEWNISKVNADNQIIQLSSKPFVFVNAANTTIILPDESQVSEMDVIYIYSLRGTNNAPIEDCAITFTSNSHPISSYKLGDGLITASVGQKIYGRFPSSGLKTIVFIDGQWFIGNFSPYSILD